MAKMGDDGGGADKQPGLFQLIRKVTQKRRQWNLVSARVVRGEAYVLGINLDERNIITSLDEGSPAQKCSQLRPGDVVVAVDGRELGESTLASIIEPKSVHAIRAWRWSGSPGADMLATAPVAVQQSMAGGRRRGASPLLAKQGPLQDVASTSRLTSHTDTGDEQLLAASAVISAPAAPATAAPASAAPAVATLVVSAAPLVSDSDSDDDRAVVPAAPLPARASLTVAQTQLSSGSDESDSDDDGPAGVVALGAGGAAGAEREEEDEYESYSSDDSRYWGISERPKTPRGMRANRAAEAEAAASAAAAAAAAVGVVLKRTGAPAAPAAPVVEPPSAPAFALRMPSAAPSLVGAAEPSCHSVAPFGAAPYGAVAPYNQSAPGSGRRAKQPTEERLASIEGLQRRTSVPAIPFRGAVTSPPAAVPLCAQTFAPSVPDDLAMTSGRAGSARRGMASAYGAGFDRSSDSRGGSARSGSEPAAVLDLCELERKIEAERGGGELVTPRGETRVRRNLVLTHKAYFEQFASRFSMLARRESGSTHGGYASGSSRGWSVNGRPHAGAYATQSATSDCVASHGRSPRGGVDSDRVDASAWEA